MSEERTFSIKGKTALITGGGKRIGRACALSLIDEGVNLIIHYNTSRKEAEEVVRIANDRGLAAWSIQADLGDDEQTQRLIDRAIKLAGPFDFLLNGASIFPKARLEELTREELFTNVQVNAWAPFVLARAFAEMFGRGQIINFLDARISGYDWYHVGYYLSKQMFAVLTRMMAMQYAPNVTVNAVAPGLILPPPGENQSYIEKLRGTTLLNKLGDPRDIAQAVVFLLKSEFITGQVIYVDGGRHLKGPAAE